MKTKYKSLQQLFRNDVRQQLVDTIKRRNLQYSGITWYNDRTDTTIEDIRSLVKEAGV